MEEALSEIIELVMERERYSHTNQLESFALHKRRVKMQSLEALGAYRKRLENGYKVIIETIENQGLHSPVEDINS